MMGAKMTKVWKTMLEQAAKSYLFLMLGIYPLFIVNSYEDLVFKKWALFLYASVAFVVVGAGCGLAYLLGHRTSLRADIRAAVRAWSATDCCVLVYFVSVVISYIGAVDKKTALWGIDTWYMGLLSQLLFVGIYFGISRGYVRKPYLKILAAVVGVIVSSIVILQRFSINVLHLYDRFGEDVKLNFVTTLGQVTWSSSYISILLIAGMGIFYLTKEKKQKIFWGICIGIGFASELLLNCDSGVITLLAAWMIMLWMSFGSRERVLSLLETIIIALTAAAGVGMSERAFKERLIPIDAVYLKVAQSEWVYIFLAAVLVLYLLIRSKRIPVSTRKQTVCILKGIYLAVVFLAMIGVILLFILHDKNYFNGSPTENYFRFTIWWGNSRGFIWRTGAAVFGDFSLWRKLFGCGPDCFTPYAYELMGDAINEFWHNQIVPNVHNEWFNALINYGVVGGAAYLGIFLSAARGYMKKALDMTNEQPVLFGTGLAAAGYIAHNVLCYQQIIGTPLIFILMGIGAAICREKNEVIQ